MKRTESCFPLFLSFSLSPSLKNNSILYYQWELMRLSRKMHFDKSLEVRIALEGCLLLGWLEFIFQMTNRSPINLWAGLFLQILLLSVTLDKKKSWRKINKPFGVKSSQIEMKEKRNKFGSQKCEIRIYAWSIVVLTEPRTVFPS